MEPNGERLQEWILLAILSTAALAGLWASVVGRMAPLRWRSAWQHWRTQPAASTVQLVLGMGPGTLLGVLTAVSLGGVGAVGWSWAIAFCSTALRWKIGRSREISEPTGLQPWLQGLWLLMGSAAFLGLHVAGPAAALGTLLPGDVRWPALGALCLGAVLPLVGTRRAAPFLAAGALVGIGANLVALGLAAGTEPSALLAVPGRAIGEALDGSPPAPPFVGALVGELLRLSMLNVGGVLLAGSGVMPWRTDDGDRTKRSVHSIALEFPLLLLMGWLVGGAAAATGAYYEPVEMHLPLRDATIYRGGFETPSQRLEPERRHRGYVRIREGRMVDVPLRVGDWQGTFESPRFEAHGNPADLALQVDERGHPIRVLMPDEHGALAQVPMRRLDEVTVVGKHLPDGPRLLARLAARSLAPPWARGAAWLGLLAWLAAAAGAWVTSVTESLRHIERPLFRIAAAWLSLGGFAIAWAWRPDTSLWLRNGLWAAAPLALWGAWRAVRSRAHG